MKKCTAALFLCLLCVFIMNCGKNQKDQSTKTNTDLTQLSSTMLYAEMYNIMTAPEKYLGKTIKMSGVYNSICIGEEDKCYHFLIVTDAGGCCPTGLELIINGKDVYPEDKTPIEVYGELKSYEFSDETYYRLAVDDIKILKKKDK